MRLLQHGLDGLELDAVGAVAASGGPVGDDADGSVGQFQFARQRRFGHAGHADDVGAVALEAVDFGGGFEARALRRGINRTIGQSQPGRDAGGEQIGAQPGIVGLGEVDMHHLMLAALVKGSGASPGVIEDLVRHDQRAGRQIGADATDRGHRDDARRPGAVAERPEVGAVVHPMRRDGVAVAVTRQKDDLAAADAAEDQRAGGLTERRARHLAPADLEMGQIGEAAAADDGKHVKFQKNFSDSSMRAIGGSGGAC